MLINPNLTIHSEFNKGNIHNYLNSVDLNFINNNTIKIKKKKEAERGHIYVSLFDDIEIGEIVVFSGKLNLLSGGKVSCYYNGFEGKPTHISNKGITKIEGVGKKNKAYNQVQLRIYHDDEVIFRFTEMKLEKDEVTPYIPHENAIETAKRQYFIGGVRSKRYSQSHKVPKQSSFGKEVAA